jgi:hypothetical protein
MTLLDRAETGHDLIGTFEVFFQKIQGHIQ